MGTVDTSRGKQGGKGTGARQGLQRLMGPSSDPWLISSFAGDFGPWPLDSPEPCFFICTTMKPICRGFVKMGDNVCVCIWRSRAQDQGAQYLAPIIFEYLLIRARKGAYVCLSVWDGQRSLSGVGPSVVEQRHEEMERSTMFMNRKTMLLKCQIYPCWAIDSMLIFIKTSWFLSLIFTLAWSYFL